MPNAKLTMQDFLDSDWETVISTAGKRECSDYELLLAQKAKELLEHNGDVAQVQVYKFLGGIYSMLLDLDNPDQPFKPVMDWGHTRSMVLDDITDDEYSLLAELVPYIQDPEAKARICDIIWVGQREHRMAMTAVESYLASAAILEDPDMWPPCYERIQRALSISLYLGPKSQSLRDVIAHIETVLDKYQGSDPSFLSSELMEMLIKRKVGDPNKYSLLAEKKALSAESASNWDMARHYWILKSRWHRLDDDTEAEKQALIRSADTNMKEAEMRVTGDNPSFSVAATYIQSAIDAYRRIGGQQDKVEALHRLLLEYQEKSVSELKAISVPFDPSREREGARNLVKGKSLTDALVALVLMHNTKKDEIRGQVIDEASQFPLRNLFTGVAVNEHGKVIHRQPGMMSDDPEQRDAAVRAQMFQKAAMIQQFSVIAFIDPARQQIISEHYVRESDFFALAQASPFVPLGREDIFARGLYAGLMGDFLVSAHLLIPQIENSIRHVLKRNGVLTSYNNAEGIQDEKDINTLLYSPELKDAFGEDLVFDLQSLLVERVGSNMRNRMAHGLLNDMDFSGVLAEYVWWITLKLCLLSWISAVEQHRKANEGTESEATESEAT